MCVCVVLKEVWVGVCVSVCVFVRRVQGTSTNRDWELLLLSVLIW